MEQDQSEQQVVQLEEHREQESNAACQICGRNGFKGPKGVQIHQSKSAVCREMRRLADARAIILAAAHAASRNGAAGEVEGGNGTADQIENGNNVVMQTEGEGAVAEQAQEQQAAQPTTLNGKAWAGVEEFAWAILKLTQWILNIIYFLMITFFGFSNIYFLCLYMTHKSPIINKTTFLLSPNFEEEFRVM